MERCCLIGGLGFLGRSLINQVLDCGMIVRVVDIVRHVPRELENKIEYYSGDYGNADFLASAVDRCDTVVLLAYATAPKTSFDDPSVDMVANLSPALRFFEVAANFPIKKIIVISSGGTVYGAASSLPIAEDHPTNPISPYGITKLAIEKYALMYYLTKKLPVIIIRPSNAYGERQRAFAGQGFIATAVASVLEGKTISVYGKPGTVRDYIHVEDIASGIMGVLQKGKIGESYNLGTGIGNSNDDILEIISRCAKTDGYVMKVQEEPARAFDVPINILSKDKLQKTTGWKDTISITEGIKRVWRCQRDKMHEK